MTAATQSHDYLYRLFGQSGRTAVVTGASSGLGAEMALALASAGADVIAVARREDRLLALAESATNLAGNITHCVADLSSADGVGAVARAVSERGGCHVLVANAGTAEVGKIESMDDESFSRVLDLNLTAQWRLAKALFEWLAKSGAGRVINISSIYGISAPVRSGLVAYAASKHGLVGLTRTQAVEWAEHGITANAIAPGYFPTEMTEQLLASKAARQLKQFVPMGRFGVPEELAPALLFLASPASSYVTGVVLPVDGGWSAW
ncbi:MAG: SDR family oxidoreductase [Gammaproteobacteria bacterium]|nr:MAG: SDR family oxidoreductase [Gammaproteobacteria bacterium]